MRSLRDIAYQEMGRSADISLSTLMRTSKADSVRHLVAIHDVNTSYKEFGGILSLLSLPIDDELNTTDAPIVKPGAMGVYTSEFRGGRITVKSHTSVKDVFRFVKVIFAGLECRVKMEEVDEVYGSIGAIAPRWHQSPSHSFPQGMKYFTMGPDGTRTCEAEIEIYDGPPDNITITCFLYEHDDGPSEEYQKKIGETVALVAATYLGGVWGLGAEAIFGDKGFLRDACVGVVDAVTATLGLADDPFDPRAFTIPHKDLLLGYAIQFEHKGKPDDNPFPQDKFFHREDTPGVKLRYNVGPVIVSGIDQGGDYGEYGLYFRVELREEHIIFGD